jgi:thioredoxin 1
VVALDAPHLAFYYICYPPPPQVAARCAIRAMPTFHFYKNGEKIAEMMGADQNKLLQLVNQHK